MQTSTFMDTDLILGSTMQVEQLNFKVVADAFRCLLVNTSVIPMPVILCSISGKVNGGFQMPRPVEFLGKAFDFLHICGPSITWGAQSIFTNIIWKRITD